MAQESCQWLFTIVDWIPQKHGKVVTRADDPLDHFAPLHRRLLESLLSLGSFSVLGVGDVLCVVKVSRPQRKVCRQREVVHPVHVALEFVDQCTLDGIPHPHRLVVRACVNQSSALAACTPSHAGDGSLVAAEHMLCSPGVDDPHSHRRVFACAGKARGVVAPEMVRLPGHLHRGLGMALEWCCARAIFGIPDAHRTVHAARGEAGAVGGPRHAQDPVGVALERMFWSACFCVPDAGRVVTAAGGKET